MPAPAGGGAPILQDTTITAFYSPASGGRKLKRHIRTRRELCLVIVKSIRRRAARMDTLVFTCKKFSAERLGLSGAQSLSERLWSYERAAVRLGR
jgi:hypothetical protein